VLGDNPLRPGGWLTEFSDSMCEEVALNGVGANSECWQRRVRHGIRLVRFLSFRFTLWPGA
jgi:hypothetical protein